MLRKLASKEFLLGVLILLTHSYFNNGLGWAQTARFDAIFSYVEAGPFQFTFIIDSLVANTGDWSYYGGHYYAAKPPGTAFLGIPLYAVLYNLESWLGISPYGIGVTTFNQYLLNVWIGSVWTALAAVLLFTTLSEMYPRSPRRVLGIVLIYAFATLVFPFNSQLWGHTTAAAFLLIALCQVLGFERLRDQKVGFFLGMAVLTDYLAIVSAISILAFYLLKRRAVHRLLLGAVFPLLLFMWYHEHCFDAFFTTSYFYVNPRFLNPELTAGLFRWPSADRVFDLLFSSNRGLFAFTPILLFALPGALRLWREGRRALVLLCVVNIVVPLLVVSAYLWWQAGWSAGPRYLIPFIPFWCILLAGFIAPRPGDRAWILALTSMAAFSACNMLAINTVSTMIEEKESNPLYGSIYRRLFTGEWGPPEIELFRDFGPLTQWQSRLHDFNLGQLMGLDHLYSLIPFVLIVLLVGGKLVSVVCRNKTA